MKNRSNKPRDNADLIEVTYQDKTRKKSTLTANGTVAIIVVVVAGMLAMGLGMAWLLIQRVS